MPTFEQVLKKLPQKFGVLSESSTSSLQVVAHNADVAVGDLFLLPSTRGHQRIYLFRATEYANILNRQMEMGDMARNKLTMPDSYLSQDLSEEFLIKIKGIILGFSEYDHGDWVFHRPRRLPEHLSEVHLIQSADPSLTKIMSILLKKQLGQDGLMLGDLLAGEQSLTGVQVQLPPFALKLHIGIFGRTGTGKSNLMMVLLDAIMNHNKLVSQGKRKDSKASILAIDPHDEFRRWHQPMGGKDGIYASVQSYTDQERADLVDPFFYLTARNIGSQGLERQLKLSRADILPEDLISVIDFTEVQTSFLHRHFGQWGEEWITRLLLGDLGNGAGNDQAEQDPEFHQATVAAAQRRVGFLRRGSSRIFSIFDPDAGNEYDSLLPDILCALESGRLLIIDTTLMSEIEQFLVTTIIARSLFDLRKALRSVEDPADLEQALRIIFRNDEGIEQTGLKTLADQLVDRLNDGRLPYIQADKLVSIDQLPYLNVVIEEAPSVLNPQRMKFGSIYRDISRQGRKFGIGLTVISQQVSEIDQGVLTQINTELNMALGNELERREAIKNASSDLTGFERELQVMGVGQIILSASYNDIPLPIQIPNYDDL